ncbi:hypothetical protein FRC09_018547 [Ceratobasidium sp. 395]|nr:hypothetical protein FRC09_018547 [Ceratobasidium sp. 395]
MSTPASIRACWQYLIALEICGYVKPLCPRTDLSYAQKKRVLQDHFFQWYGDSSSDAVVAYYELPTGKGRVEASAKGTTVWFLEGTTGLMFFQNPSNNRETLAQGLPEDTFGLLEIYKFDPLAPSPALHVASLALPAGTIKDERNITAVYFSFSLYLPPSLQPQVWGISPNTRLICVSINGTLQWENVCVQAQTLLKYAGTASNGIVRWDEWGPETVWDKWNGPISRCSHVTTHDQRLVSMKSLWIAQEIEVNLFELERTKDSQIVPVLKAELAFGPKRRSKRNVMLFRDTLASGEQIRDLVLWAF